MAKVQFNLLPDVKVAYETARQTQTKVFSISLIVTSVAVALLVISYLMVGLGQKKLLNDADKKITKVTNQISAIPNINKILTIQNQLSELPSLHSSKHITSRIFDYLPQLTPPSAGINKLDIDTTAGTISISGKADAVSTVNQFVDTLKFTKFSLNGSKDASPAFNTVVLSSVDRDNQGATYTITANYDPALLDPAKTANLTVPQQLTTQSITNAPPIFTGQSTTNSGSTP